MSQAISFPEDYFRLDLFVWHNAILEASNKAAIRHDASLQLYGNWTLTNREDNLIVSACRSLCHLHAFSQITRQTLAAAVYVVSANEDLTVAAPRYACFLDRFIFCFTCSESHIPIIQRLLVKYIEIWREQEHHRWCCHSKVLLIWRPGSSPNPISYLTNLFDSALFNSVKVHPTAGVSELDTLQLLNVVHWDKVRVFKVWVLICENNSFFELGLRTDHICAGVKEQSMVWGVNDEQFLILINAGVSD